MKSAPVFLSIAGSDCSAGAGLQADLKTGFALGCYPLTAVTCVVSEMPGRVEGLAALEPEFVSSQVTLLLRHYPVRAVKTGMLYSPEIVEAVADALSNFGGSVVVDPVMIATAGEPLMQQTAIRVYEEKLLPLTDVLTPNLDELQALLRRPEPIGSVDELTQAAQLLAARYNCAVLAKGGHLAGEVCTDVLALPGGETRTWSHPRCRNISTHGTGCTLSAALAAFLSGGLPLIPAAAEALAYTHAAIASSLDLGGIHALQHRADTSGCPASAASSDVP